MVDGPVTSWRWDFGDGTKSTAKNPIHTYTTRGTYTVRLEVSTLGGTDALVVPNYINVREVVRFPDVRLDAALRGALEIPVGSIRVADLERLTTFNAADSGISNIAGLNRATNLESLYLDGNAIVDVSPLSPIRSLRALNLRDNQIGSIAPLKNLVALEELDLGINNITDIRPLASLLKLALLNLERNPDLTDIRTLEHLTTLRELSLAFTNILQNDTIDGAGNGDGLNALRPLTNLIFLDLAATSIHDLRSIQGLTALQTLILFECQIEDITPLSRLVELRELQLSANGIVNVSALSGLDQLRELTLQMNQISSLSPLVLNQGLGNNDVVRLTDNPLDSVSLCSAIPTLELRGVIVEVNQSCASN